MNSPLHKIPRGLKAGASGPAEKVHRKNLLWERPKPSRGAIAKEGKDFSLTVEMTFSDCTFCGKQSGSLRLLTPTVSSPLRRSIQSGSTVQDFAICENFQTLNTEENTELRPGAREAR